MSAVASEPHPRGERIEIAPGRRAHLLRAGPAASERPAIVLESGSFGFSSDWAAVQDRLAAAGLRSLAYDRAGLGFSDPGPEPRDSLAIVRDLEILLDRAAEAGPFIVCGHSMAGLHVRLFAGRNRARVRGVVLVDATTPEAMADPGARQFVSGFTRLSQLAALGAEAGLLRAMGAPFGDAIGLPHPAKAEKRWAFADPGHNRWAAAEVREWPRGADQAAASGPYDPELPIAVVLTGEGAGTAAREAPARLSRRGVVIRVRGANHATLLGTRHAGRIAEAILKVEAAARAG